VLVGKGHGAGRGVQVHAGHGVECGPAGGGAGGLQGSDQVAQPQAAGRMAHQVDLQLIAPELNQVGQGVHQLVAGTVALPGELGVFFDL